jgi:hypothetical protein
MLLDTTDTHPYKQMLLVTGDTRPYKQMLLDDTTLGFSCACFASRLASKIFSLGSLNLCGSFYYLLFNLCRQWIHPGRRAKHGIYGAPLHVADNFQDPPTGRHD